MALDRETKNLLRKALTIRDSEVPIYRVLDILATQDGDISEVINRYGDIRDAALRAALHYCARLLRELAAAEGLLPAWEIEAEEGEAAPAREKKSAESGKTSKRTKQELEPFVDESMRGKLTTAKVFIDGASRGNPGPAGIGIAIFTMDGRKVAQQAQPIGVATNNIAEYTALIEGLKLVQSLGVRQVFVISDSELLVRQMTGQYKVRNPDIFAKVREAQQLAKSFQKFTVSHVTRENNKLADALSNYALDVVAKRELEENSPAPRKDREGKSGDEA
jgi:ribonuclease HI